MYRCNPQSKGMRHQSESLAFTLIELLIVVAIIAILAAIAVPNFLEAQVRAKASRAQTDMRSLATAIEAYHVDFGSYPEGTDNPNNYPEEIGALLGPLAPGYYSFRTRGANGEQVGVDFAGLTTPVAFIGSIPADPFVSSPYPFAYAYRNAKARRNGWIISSVGPDNDLLEPGGVGSTNAANPLSTASDTKSPARIGDINEREVIHYIEGDTSNPSADLGLLREHLIDLTYDATNGTVSEGDLWRSNR